jgi:hypothetical protein
MDCNRVPALQEGSSDFKPQSDKKKIKRTKNRSVSGRVSEKLSKFPGQSQLPVPSKGHNSVLKTAACNCWVSKCERMTFLILRSYVSKFSSN